MKVDRTLSINEIRGGTEPPSEFQSSLIERHEAALATPLIKLSADQIALLVRQRTEPDLVVPLAVALLAEQPLLDAGLYPGDLFAAVLQLPADFWLSHPTEWFDVDGILGQVDSAVSAINESRKAFEMAAPRKHRESIS